MSDDRLRSEDTLEAVLALCEGPIVGLVDGHKSFFIGETPLQSATGEYNFENFTLNFFPGDADPSPVEFALGGQGSSYGVNVALSTDSPVVRQTSTTTADGIEVRLSISSLLRIEGDKRVENTLKVKIEYKPASTATWLPFMDSGAEITITGLATSIYIKEFRRAVAPGDRYDIRVTKTTEENTDKLFSDVTWETYQEVLSPPKTFYDTALIQIIGKASEQLSSVPQLSGVYRGRIIRVPTNYDPETRHYAGAWDGTFKLAYSNNPVWCLYDFIMDARYGVNSYYPVQLDKYEAYEAALWCDGTVPDGAEGTQPRYTFNDLITEPNNGKEFARYVAGSFNAVLFDDLNGTLILKIDKDEQAAALFTPESVYEEGFEYSYVDLSNQYNDISVLFINPDINWQEDRIRVYDQEHIDKYGRIPLDFVAIGCTNRHEAKRRGYYKLVTALTEKEFCSFTTNRFGQFVAPYDVVLIADPDMGRSLTGRFSRYSINRLIGYLRDPIYLEAGVTYKLKIQSAGEILERNIVDKQIGINTHIKFNTALPENIPKHATFSIEALEAVGLPKPYRVMKLSEVDGDPDKIRIDTVEINRNKWDDIDNTTISEPPDYERPFAPVVEPPTNVTISNVSYTSRDGTYVPELRIEWTHSPNAFVDIYEAQYRRQGTREWSALFIVMYPENWATVTSIAGAHDYEGRVRAHTTNGRYSPWAYGLQTSGDLLDPPPNPPTNLVATGGFKQIALSWVNPLDLDLAHIEVFENLAQDIGSSYYKASVAANSYIVTGLGSQETRYYWVRAVDRSGNTSEFNNTLGAAATTQQLGNDDILDGILDESKLVPELADRIRDIHSQFIEDIEAYLTDIFGVAYEEMPAKIEFIAEQIIEALMIADEHREMITENYEYITGLLSSYDLDLGELDAKVEQYKVERVNADGALAQTVTNLGSRVDNNESQILSEQTTRASADSAMASEITILTAKTNDNEALILQKAETLTDEVSAISTVTTQLTSRIGGAETDIALTQADLLVEQQTRADEDGAISSLITSLQVRVGEAEGSIDAEQIARIHDDDVLLQNIIVLQGRVGAAEGAIANESNLRINADNVIANELSGLTGRVSDAEGTIVQNRNLSIDENHALVEDINLLTGRVADNEGKIYNIEELEVREDSALARKFTDIDVVTNDNIARLVTLEQTISGVEGSIAEQINSLTVAFGTLEDEDAAIRADLFNFEQAYLKIDDFDTRAGAYIENHVQSEITTNRNDIANIKNLVNLEGTAIANKFESIESVIGPGGVNIQADWQNDIIAYVSDGLQPIGEITQKIQEQINIEVTDTDGTILNGIQGEIESATNSESGVINHKFSETVLDILNGTSELFGPDAKGIISLTHDVTNIQSNIGDITDPDSLFGKVQTVSETVAIQTDTLKKVQNWYTLETEVYANGQRYISGFGFESGFDTESSFTSEFAINADRFLITHPALNEGQPSLVFSVEDGEVRMKDAFVNTLVGQRLRSEDGKFMIDLHNKQIRIEV